MKTSNQVRRNGSAPAAAQQAPKPTGKTWPTHPVEPPRRAAALPVKEPALRNLPLSELEDCVYEVKGTLQLMVTYIQQSVSAGSELDAIAVGIQNVSHNVESRLMDVFNKLQAAATGRAQ
jgi:hypothetical protein